MTFYKRSAIFQDNVIENVGEKPINVEKNVGKNRQKKLTRQARRESVLETMRVNPKISSPQLAEIFGVAERTINRDIASLRKAMRLARLGGGKGGNWVVL